MLEQVYADVIQEPVDDQDPKSRTTKKRKINATITSSHASTPDGDDEDDMYYGAVSQAKGKKAKGGTGYAGDGKEDVSFFNLHMPQCLLSSIVDIWSN